MSILLPNAPAGAIDVLRLPSPSITVRAMGPADADRLQGHVRGLSRASRQNRFLGGVNELPAAELERMTGNGGGHVFGLFAEAVMRGETHVVGEAVYAVQADRGLAEFALSVADAWQGRGVGQALIASMECRALLAGSLMLTGETLRTNEAMLALAAKSGFVVRRHPEEARLVRLEKVIGAFQGLTPAARLNGMHWSRAAA